MILKGVISWCELVCQKVNTVGTKRFIVDIDFELLKVEREREIVYAIKTIHSNINFELRRKFWNFTFFNGAALLDGVDCSIFFPLDIVKCGKMTAIITNKIGNSMFFFSKLK